MLTKCCYYAQLCSSQRRELLCSKLCQHNVPRPNRHRLYQKKEHASPIYHPLGRQHDTRGKQATTEDGEVKEAGSTPPPSYHVYMEMEPHGSERSIVTSRDGSHDALSDCTASTELEIGERGEGGIRHGSPESCELPC